MLDKNHKNVICNCIKSFTTQVKMQLLLNLLIK